MWRKFGNSRKTNEWSWFKFNNLGLEPGTNMKFYTSMAKGLKLSVRKFWGLNSTFVEVTGKKLVWWEAFWQPLFPILNRVKSTCWLVRQIAPVDDRSKTQKRRKKHDLLQRRITSFTYQRYFHAVVNRLKCCNHNNLSQVKLNRSFFRITCKSQLQLQEGKVILTSHHKAQDLIILEKCKIELSFHINIQLMEKYVLGIAGFTLK